MDEKFLRVIIERVHGEPIVLNDVAEWAVAKILDDLKPGADAISTIRRDELVYRFDCRNIHTVFVTTETNISRGEP